MRKELRVVRPDYDLEPFFPTVIQLTFFHFDFCYFFVSGLLNSFQGKFMSSSAMGVPKGKFNYAQTQEEEMYSWGGLGTSRD